MDYPELYFKTPELWRDWLKDNHLTTPGVYIILYKIESKKPSMRWEEAVKVALCYGWIDSTVKRIDHERRRQYFCPRKPKSVWSKLNKTYIIELEKSGLMHQSGRDKIVLAKSNGSWTALDDVENLIIPPDLKIVFNNYKKAYVNYQNFAPSYRKSYLYWLNQAKREVTRQNRIAEIIRLCDANIKSRD